MLKTNNKIVRDRVNNYIYENWNLYEEEQNRTQEETHKAIIEAFIIEAYNTEYEKKQTRQAAFIDWLRGLPRCLGDHWLYYGNNEPIKILGDMLEQTETERNKYEPEQAANLLSKLIYSEVFKNYKEA